MNFIIDLVVENYVLLGFSKTSGFGVSQIVFFKLIKPRVYEKKNYLKLTNRNDYFIYMF